MPKELLFLSLVLILAGTICNAELPAEVESLKGALVYENTYDDATSLEDIVAEGPMDAKINNGKLYMASYGGHFTTWYKPVDHPESFIIEWEFTPVEAKGLCILFTCAKGLNGEDIFDPSLPARNGSYTQYHSGSINNYGLSYYRNNRSYSDSVNLRRNKGFDMVAAVTPNPIPLPPACVGNTYHLVWIKSGPIIRWYVDGQKTLEWTDSNPWGSGKFGLRQMSATVAEYDNLRVWAIGTTRIGLNNGQGAGPGVIRCWPNPFTTSTQINVLLQNANCKLQIAKLEIVDITGRIVRVTSDVRRETYVWDATGFPNGIYVIRAELDGKVINQKIIKR